jgi:hypothetical protein
MAVLWWRNPAPIIDTMMYSIDLNDDTEEGADIEWEIIDKTKSPVTPTSDDYSPQAHGIDTQRYEEPADEGNSEDEYVERRAPKKKGGYDSRVEQILYESPELPILIVDAGKSLESGGKYIVYTIRTGVSCTSSDPISVNRIY